MNKPAVIKIIDTLGSTTIEGAFGVSSHAVRSARTQGVFPAAWFDLLEKQCLRAGVSCPRDAFNWRGVGDQAQSAKEERHGEKQE